jgi:hypothetical protein
MFTNAQASFYRTITAQKFMIRPGGAKSARRTNWKLFTTGPMGAIIIEQNQQLFAQARVDFAAVFFWTWKVERKRQWVMTTAICGGSKNLLR